MSGIRVVIESRKASEVPSLKRDGVYFFFSGKDATGEDFCGSADDLPTAFSMIEELLHGIYGDGFSYD